MHCLTKIETTDQITGHRFVSHYRYAHGYYDRAEREFRGFGMVEQTDAEHFEHWVKGGSSNVVEQDLHQQPVVTRRWFHTGAFLEGAAILGQFADDYWHSAMVRHGFPVSHNERDLPDARLIAAPDIDPALLNHLNGLEHRQAVRTCKGMALAFGSFCPRRARCRSHPHRVTG